ncbi:MAG TPA: SdrD B-like domain-containing protein, partial [Anaerolineales bacterium]|nr:SdrD B-like domain-containing protein [Anaerolineales bacterium]
MPRKFPVLLFVALLTSCGYQQTIQVTSTAMEPQNSPATSATTTVPTQTFTPQPRLLPITVGPEQENFPTGVNPLTGLEVADSTLLEYPAVLVSISNMPVTARPQAGPAFVPWIFELYIGEGSTRFMGVFYGDHLREVPNVTGGCNVRAEIYRPQGDWIGNRVWLDENENGQQDAWEMGVGGVCVRLLNGSNHEVQSETTTDSNGYFAFENPGTDSIIQILIPDSYQFTKQDLGNEDRDSDVDVATGETKKFRSNSTDSFWDAGLILTEKQIATSSPVVTGTPPDWFFPSGPYVGPVRSGRLTYNQIGGMFPNSCLVYASAAYDVAERLDSCEIVYGVDKTTPNSALLPLTRLRELAKERLNPKQPVNYSGNLFSDSIPEGGQAANTIDIYFHLYSQSG